MAVTQGGDSVSERTNASSTVLMSASKTAVTNLIFDSADMLGLLENSYNTKLPKGSQLVLSLSTYDFSIHVADGTGRATVLIPGGTFFIATVPGGPQLVRSRTLTVVSKSTASGNTLASAHSTVTITETVVLRYDDSNLTTADGTHTKFEITCVIVGKASVNLKTDLFNDAVKIKGLGGGIIRGQEVILEMRGSANISGSR